MQKDRIIIGLKRASWLFALISGLVTAIVINASRYVTWDRPDEYVFGSIIAAVIAFFVFRVGIWVFKAFAGIEDESNE